MVVGVVPAAGGDIAGLIGWDRAKRMSKHPEKFGKGSLEGLTAADTASSATLGGCGARRLGDVSQCVFPFGAGTGVPIPSEVRHPETSVLEFASRRAGMTDDVMWRETLPSNGLCPALGGAESSAPRTSLRRCVATNRYL